MIALCRASGGPAAAAANTAAEAQGMGLASTAAAAADKVAACVGRFPAVAGPTAC